MFRHSAEQLSKRQESDRTLESIRNCIDFRGLKKEAESERRQLMIMLPLKKRALILLCTSPLPHSYLHATNLIFSFWVSTRLEQSAHDGIVASI
jgi:hypothetical protein